MVHAEKAREVIIALKKVRAEYGYSLQRIQDMVIDNGGNVSLATIKRVFAEGSEEQNFRYEDSLKPIAAVLLDITPTAVAKEESSEIAALKAIILAKDEAIASEKAKVAYLKEQSERKDKLLDERRDFIYRKDRVIALLAVLLAVCVLVIIAALVIDKTNPDMGFFWLDRVSSFLAGENIRSSVGL